MESGFVSQTPEAIEQWVATLAQRFQGRPIAVALEQSRGALLFALTKYEHLILYPIHPARLAHYRKSFRPSGAKDDPSDAELLLNYLCNHRDQVRPLQPDTEDTRALQFLVEARRRIVDDKTRFKNRLTAVLASSIIRRFSIGLQMSIRPLPLIFWSAGLHWRICNVYVAPPWTTSSNSIAAVVFRSWNKDGSKSSLQFQQRKTSLC